jgi:hypothetical protein
LILLVGFVNVSIAGQLLLFNEQIHLMASTDLLDAIASHSINLLFGEWVFGDEQRTRDFTIEDSVAFL